MGQQADFTVFDGAATPVSHILRTDGVSREGPLVTASWKEANALVPDGAQTRAFQMRQTLRSGTIKSTSRIDVAVMEAVSGVNAQGYTAPPKVAYVDRFELVNYGSPRSTETTKRIAMQMLLNWATNTATSVTPVAAGPVAELHQKAVIVS